MPEPSGAALGMKMVEAIGVSGHWFLLVLSQQRVMGVHQLRREREGGEMEGERNNFM